MQFKIFASLPIISVHTVCTVYIKQHCTWSFLFCSLFKLDIHFSSCFSNYIQSSLEAKSISSICIMCMPACSVQFSHSVVSDSMWLHGLQHTRPPCQWLSQWCHPTVSSSVVPFSSCLQSFPASGSFQMNQLFASGGQRIGVSALASVFPMNIQDWFLLGSTGWISLQSKGLSRVFSNTTVQKHQFFGAQLSL